MNKVVEVDTVISAKWIITMAGKNSIHQDSSLVIDKERIVSIEANEVVFDRFKGKQNFELGNQVLMPGLINAHGHAAMSLLRGFADDVPLMAWLEQHIWPAEQKWVDHQFVYDGTELAIAEMLKSGTTCFSDMYFYPNASASCAEQSGMRVQIVFPVLEFPSVWAQNADEYIQKGLQVKDDFSSSHLVSVGFGPHAPYTVSDSTMEAVALQANEFDIPIQIHLHETAEEVNRAIEQTGVRPLQRLNDIGLLNTKTQCVHLTQLVDSDIALLADSKAKTIHCPESNLKLASGICPVAKLKNNKIPVGLGTDGAASNNDLDMFGELYTAAILAKVGAYDASALCAYDTLKLATLDSARALGIEHKVGSFESGKFADVIALDLDHISNYPMFDLYSHLVYNNRHTTVTHAWVGGKLLLQNQRFTQLDENRIKVRALEWQNKLKASQR